MMTTDNCHLIIRSPLASTFGRIVRPISLAVFRLMINSNFIGCSTVDLVVGSPARRHGKDRGLTGFRTYPYADSGRVAVHYWTTIFRPELGEVGTFASVCCASADDQSAKSIAQRPRTVIFCFMFFSLSRSTRHLTLAPSHLITLSALASTFGGIVRPICFAVFTLTANSNFPGCSTGRSDGWRPDELWARRN
jgi:hypothetical protein